MSFYSKPPLFKYARSSVPDTSLLCPGLRCPSRAQPPSCADSTACSYSSDPTVLACKSEVSSTSLFTFVLNLVTSINIVKSLPSPVMCALTSAQWAPRCSPAASPRVKTYISADAAPSCQSFPNKTTSLPGLSLSAHLQARTF